MFNDPKVKYTLKASIQYRNAETISIGDYFVFNTDLNELQAGERQKEAICVFQRIELDSFLSSRVYNYNREDTKNFIFAQNMTTNVIIAIHRTAVVIPVVLVKDVELQFTTR